ncbi:MAG: hypothetical protein COU90_01880 [Candidatus Ryanbacteria bacterium CG10_big_fil_rev_8_21_14_0_10_43_42]|uniref:Glycosyl transferase family 1 domain-containing protein n=1 Tax=Candidatus Ryanbacteria bacterium CG10_big_fil_rev_8_21_14_0_10_43_42 TaxID=1974864 RepID=A0A2M8KXB0_9BACT|nr:MAG: hypothetical protein COU90_01880 [Candidatus Ryanbacteria bacterium CG10_big_fil_rev_8_21_14_0_10_43_42]
MNILMLSRDPAVKDHASDTAQRLQEYRNLVDDMHIALLDMKGSAFSRLRGLYMEGRAFLALGNNKGMLITAQDPFEVGLVGYLLHMRFRAPLQLQVHTDLFSPYFRRESFKNRIRVYMALFLLKRADCVRVVSRRVKDSLVMHAKVKEERITVLPVFVDVMSYTHLPRIDDEHSIIFLIVSRLSKEKNIPLILRAFSVLSKKHTNVRLTIVGDGPERENLERLVARLGLKPLVEFKGRRDAVVTYYQLASCFVLASNYEGYARTVVEALASGTPVIMTDVGVAGEVVTHESNGLVVPVGDENAFLNTMIRIVEDKNLRMYLSEEGKKIISALPAKELYLQKYKESWEKCGPLH